MIYPKQIDRKLKVFSDNSYLKYSTGRFDNFCIYICYSNGEKKVPTDIKYFQVLNKLKETFTSEKLYDDFINIYEHTKEEIDKIANSYGKYSLIVNKIFSILYLGMLSEENKSNTKLGKRIKRLGVHEVLINKKTPEYAANFMKNMSWREIDIICKNYGF